MNAQGPAWWNISLQHTPYPSCSRECAGTHMVNKSLWTYFLPSCSCECAGTCMAKHKPVVIPPTPSCSREHAGTCTVNKSLRSYLLPSCSRKCAGTCMGECAGTHLLLCLCERAGTRMAKHKPAVTLLTPHVPMNVQGPAWWTKPTILPLTPRTPECAGILMVNQNLRSWLLLPCVLWACRHLHLLHPTCLTCALCPISYIIPHIDFWRAAFTSICLHVTLHTYICQRAVQYLTSYMLTQVYSATPLIFHMSYGFNILCHISILLTSVIPLLLYLHHICFIFPPSIIHVAWVCTRLWQHRQILLHLPTWWFKHPSHWHVMAQAHSLHLSHLSLYTILPVFYFCTSIHVARARICLWQHHQIPLRLPIQWLMVFPSSHNILQFRLIMHSNFLSPEAKCHAINDQLCMHISVVINLV